MALYKNSDLVEVGDAVAGPLVLARDRHAHPVVVGLQLVIAPAHQRVPNVHCSASAECSAHLAFGLALADLKEKLMVARS